MSTWRVVLNAKLWNQKLYREMWTRSPEDRVVYQSKGRRNMIVVPQKGDHVLFVIKGQVVMRGVCGVSGFLHGDAHRRHVCCVGDERPHAVPEEYSIVYVHELCEAGVTVPFKGRNTWAKM